ncbi:hypothetical protein GQ472_00305 [archaeon]|nr:hypothetical protein [archaeon]
MHPHDRLANIIKENLDVLEEPCFFYDTDFDGCASMTALEKIYDFLRIRTESCHINYSDTSAAIRFAREKKPKEIIFVDYEPHEKEFEEICRHAENVIILGHHQRPDIKMLEETDKRVKYLNPRDYYDGNSKRRGLPIVYFLNKVAELYGVDTSFQASVGLRGYGFSDLAKEIEEKKGLEVDIRKVQKIISKGLMLVSYRLECSKYLVDALRLSKNYEENAMHILSERLKRPDPEKEPKDVIYLYERLMESAKENIVIFEKEGVVGDLLVFQLKHSNGDYFEQIKAFLHDPIKKGLHNHATDLGYYTSLSINFIGGKRKASMRSNNYTINIAEILKKTFEDLPEIEPNFGGHENSGGFVCWQEVLPDVITAFANNYFEATEQNIRISKEDLNGLNDNDDEQKELNC